jgi:enamine deaminase RidA (YjgF/YER057c/UK114 family)
MTRQNFSTGTPWESAVGYSRAVRVGSHVFVSGTTASAEDGATVCVGDSTGQTRFALQKIVHALREVGAELRTRGVFVLNADSDIRRRSAPKAFRGRQPLVARRRADANVCCRH